jgi:hypothetical protein
MLHCGYYSNKQRSFPDRTMHHWRREGNLIRLRREKTSISVVWKCVWDNIAGLRGILHRSERKAVARREIIFN